MKNERQNLSASSGDPSLSWVNRLATRGLVGAAVLLSALVGCVSEELDLEEGSDLLGTSVSTTSTASTSEESAEASSSEEGDTLVADEADLADDPVLAVSVEELDFGSETVVLTFDVRNDGGGTMSYDVASDVAWAAVWPTGGTNTGSDDPIVVSVSREGLLGGDHSGYVNISTEDGQSHGVAVSLSMASPNLELATDALDFGPTAQVQTFTVGNTGGGTLTYTIAADVDWLIVEPDHGEVTDRAMIEVWVRRDSLVTGDHEAQLTVEVKVESAPLAVATVEVRAEKPLTSPQIVPWIEVNSDYYGYYPPSSLESAVEGLLIWQRITDTAIVSTTPGNAPLYTELRQRVPGMQIIPGLKTSLHLGLDGFDQLDAWELIAQDVSEMAATSGQTRFVFENEGALYGYWDGDYSIDFDQMRQCLGYLPTELEYIWYPGLGGETPFKRARSQALCEAVEDELHPRFVNLGFDRPQWRESDPWSYVTLDELAEKPTMPIIYFGCWTVCYWEYGDVDQVLEDLETYPEDYPEAIFYPGFYRWVEAADAITMELAQDQPLP